MPHAYEPHLLSIALDRSRAELREKYAGELPAIRSLTTLPLHPHVTFFIGENGSGKSTLLEAIAVAEGFNAEGGSRSFNFATMESHADLYKWVRLVRSTRGRRRSDGFFLRAESFYNVISEIERLGVRGAYGPRSYHDQSHGESFLELLTNRLRGDGLYLFDEPEAALSPQRQLAFLVALDELVQRESQFIIATHSPIIMAYPNAAIYEFTPAGIRRVAYRDTEHFRVMHAFLESPERSLRLLLEGDDDSDGARDG
ncbi:MAG: AAA family ATPase [Planctomycetaceae bacterium]|nr:AAA family ATPase [Planctomycetaceae bacterium]